MNREHQQIHLINQTGLHLISNVLSVNRLTDSSLPQTHHSPQQNSMWLWVWGFREHRSEGREIHPTWPPGTQEVFWWTPEELQHRFQPSKPLSANWLCVLKPIDYNQSNSTITVDTVNFIKQSGIFSSTDLGNNTSTPKKNKCRRETDDIMRFSGC